MYVVIYFYRVYVIFNDYIRTIIENDVIFCSGPSGSGKSFVASGVASEHLHAKKIEKIIVRRVPSG